MKKFRYLIVAALLLFSCLGLTAFAADSSVTISDDYQKLYMNGNSYSRFNVSRVETYYDLVVDTPVELSATQQELIASVELQTNAQENVVHADIYFNDGAVLSVGFLQDDYLEAYNEFISSEDGIYVIDFEWPAGNTVDATTADLLGNETTLDRTVLEWCSHYPVIIRSADGSLELYKGALIVFEDKYYYSDFDEIGVTDWYDFNPYSYDYLAAHEITNASLLADIQEAENEFYADDLGFLYNDDLTEVISTIFLVFVFAVIPLAILIVFLILAIRSKTIYRKLFSGICIFSGAELIVFGIITALIMM